MRVHRMVFGFRFNKRVFRIGSLRGVIIDEILALKENEKIGGQYFKKFEIAIRADDDRTITFVDDDGSRKLTITSTDILYKKTAINNQSSINFDTTTPELIDFWECMDKIVKFPDVRRIGVVNEYRSSKPSETNCIDLIKGLTKIEEPKISSNFKLEFNKRLIEKTQGNTINVDVDAFEQVNYALYCSELDETPADGLVHANIDYQKYYNPCKARPMDELRRLKTRINEEKEKFVEFVRERGFE